MSQVEIRVLGPVEVRVDGEDATSRLTESQRGLLAVLASARDAISKDALRRHVAIARSSLDPQLSKLRSALGLDRPLHRSRWPRSGHVALDRTAVVVDADEFLDLVDRAAGDHAAHSDDAALRSLLAADDLWRGEPYDELDVPVAAEDDSPVVGSLRTLRAARRRARELAARCWLREPGRLRPTALRLQQWAESEVDSSTCWLAATRAVLQHEGPVAARTLLARWDAVAFDQHSSDAHPRAVAERLVREAEDGTDRAVPVAERSRDDVVAVLLELAGRAAARFDYDAVVEATTTALDHASPTARPEILAQRADAHRFRGDWDAAERDLVAAADEAHAAGDLAREADATLAMARISWDPERFEGTLDQRLERLLEQLGPEHADLRIRVEACFAGGTYQDGTVDPARTEQHARRALELVDELDDELVEAQVLSDARKALIDVDPPQIQLERARRIQALGRRSAHHRCLGHIDAIVDLLLLGRVDVARDETEHYRRAVHQTESRFHEFQLAGLDALWSLHDGRLDDAASQTSRAEHLGTALNVVTVLQVVAGQRVWHAYESGDTDGLRACLAPLDAFAETAPTTAVWDVAGAYFRIVLGDVDAASARFRGAAARTGEFRELPRGPLRITTLAFAAMSAAALASAGEETSEVGASLLAQLAAHDARAVLVGWPVFYLGSKRRFEGLAALAAGDTRLAVDHLTAAADENRDDGPVRRRTLDELAMARARAV